MWSKRETALFWFGGWLIWWGFGILTAVVVLVCKSCAVPAALAVGESASPRGWRVGTLLGPVLWVALAGTPAGALQIADLTGRGCGDGGPLADAAISPAGLSWSTGELLVADSKCFSVRGIALGMITRLAGSGVRGNQDGPALGARLMTPSGVTRGLDGLVYWTEWQTNRVRRLTAGGQVETVATLGVLSQPRGIAATSDALYVADPGGSRLVRIALPCTAPCPPTTVPVPVQTAFGVFADGEVLYIANTWAHRIQRYANGALTTVAGNGLAGFAGDGGPATAAKLYAPTSVVVAPDGSFYIADGRNNRVRRVGTDGVITTVAGNGQVQSAVTGTITPGDVGGDPLQLPMSPNALALDDAGVLYIASEVDGVVYQLVADAFPTPSATVPAASTYTPRPTYTLEATHSPLPSRTPPATFTPVNTYTQVPTFTPQPQETAAECPPCPARCDVTGNGTISVLDAVRIQQYVTGLCQGSICDPSIVPPCTPTP